MIMLCSTLIAFGLLTLYALLWWIARGEADVNGDPERDSGIDPDDVTTVCMDCSAWISGPRPHRGLVSHGLCRRCAEHRILELENEHASTHQTSNSLTPINQYGYLTRGN